MKSAIDLFSRKLTIISKMFVITYISLCLIPILMFDTYSYVCNTNFPGLSDGFKGTSHRFPGHLKIPGFQDFPRFPEWMDILFIRFLWRYGLRWPIFIWEK